MIGGDAAWLEELLDLYVSDTEKRLSELRQILDAQDMSGLKTLSHTMKGTSGNVGAHVMQDLCLKMEKLALSDDAVGARAHYNGISEEFKRIQEDIRPALESVAVTS